MQKRYGTSGIALLLTVLALCSVGLSVYIVLRQLKTPLPTTDKPEIVTPAMPQGESPTPQQTYICPEMEWVDCMPGPDKETKEECTEAFLTWAKENCPNFKGAAY